MFVEQGIKFLLFLWWQMIRKAFAKICCLILCLAEALFLKEFFFCFVNSRLLGLTVYLVKSRAWPEATRLAINFNFLLKSDLG
jgi:hypothetical protein